MQRKFLRRSVAVVMLIGIALVTGCSSNRCRCSCRTHGPVGQYSPVVSTAPVTTEIADNRGTTSAMDDVDLTTKHVAGLGGELEEQQSIDRQPLLGHGGNYEWLFGVLQRVHVPKKGWKLRYAPLDLKDRWGGSVVPAPDIRIDSFEEGDNVYVEGEIIDDRASLYLSGPRYRINSIRRVEQEDYRRVAEGR